MFKNKICEVFFMEAWKKYAIIAVVALAAVALTFRVPAVRKFVTGA
jgi:hypothetical protein